MTNTPFSSSSPRLPDKLRQALDIIRPVLQQDGGDMELVEEET